MWTLAEARARVTARVGENSTVFWSQRDRDDAVNDAVRFIAAATQGVPKTVQGQVSAAQPYLEVDANIVGMHGSAGEIVGGPALTMVPIDVADAIFPGWRTFKGRPRWVVIDQRNNRAYFTPVPEEPTTVSATVAVVPREVYDDEVELFFGNPAMEKYLGALVNYAVAMLLLKERFDGDAERFYNLARNELVDVGVDPGRVPQMRTGAVNADNG